LKPWFVFNFIVYRVKALIDIQKTISALREHLKVLTLTIGERSVVEPQNLEKTARYIESCYERLGLAVQRENYPYQDYTVANIVADIPSSSSSSPLRYLIGAHYDSVCGTVGADDNASAIAVQLEVARQLQSLNDKANLDANFRFVSFALEEPPAYGTPYMGSRVYAKNARRQNERIDGMICLEMVGYACHRLGCQQYPFPLNFFKYPKAGEYIGIVGNLKSRNFSRSLYREFKKNKELPAIKLNVPFNGWIMPAIRLSDHASFWDQGYRAVMVTDTAFFRNPHYHAASDTMDKLDIGFMAEVVESLLFFCGTRRG
jgi:Zn-dependent M28 family amino/carboxypeptidase